MLNFMISVRLIVINRKKKSVINRVYIFCLSIDSPNIYNLEQAKFILHYNKVKNKFM